MLLRDLRLWSPVEPPPASGAAPARVPSAEHLAQDRLAGLLYHHKGHANVPGFHAAKSVDPKTWLRLLLQGLAKDKNVSFLLLLLLLIRLFEKNENLNLELSLVS